MNRIAIDLGSGVTKIYLSGCGVVLTEATCVAVDESLQEGKRKYTVKAYGDKARALSGRAAQSTHIVNPVDKGDIVHENLAALLLSHFLEKIEIPFRKAKRTEALFIVPCGIKAETKRKYLHIAEECGLGGVYFTQTPFAAVLGHNVAINESQPMFSLDIGYSLTNIAAISQDGIIYGVSVGLGSGAIDVKLMDDLAENSNFKIGALTAEKLKNTVGSLLADDNKMAVVDGREISSGAPASLAVNSGMIAPIISAYADKIVEYVQFVLTKLPAEVSSGVMRGGIYLSGGFMMLDGLPEYIEKKLNIRVNMPEEPRLAAVMGGGAILADDDLLERFCTTE